MVYRLEEERKEYPVFNNNLMELIDRMIGEKELYRMGPQHHDIYRIEGSFTRVPGVRKG